MKTFILNQQFQLMLRQRNASLVFGLLMAVSNVLLVSNFIIRGEKVILVPPQLQQSVWVSGNRVSASYLEEMALWYSHLLLDKNVSSQRYQHKILLNHVAPKRHDELVGALLKDESHYQSLGLSTYFNVKRMESYPGQLKVKLFGELRSHMGGKKVSQDEREIQVSFELYKGQLYFKEMLKGGGVNEKA